MSALRRTTKDTRVSYVYRLNVGGRAHIRYPVVNEGQQFVAQVIEGRDSYEPPEYGTVEIVTLNGRLHEVNFDRRWITEHGNEVNTWRVMRSIADAVDEILGIDAEGQALPVDGDDSPAVS